MTAEAFYCARDDSIIRGCNSKYSKGRDGITIVTGTCTLCGAKLRKKLKPEKTLTIPPHPNEDISPAARKVLEAEYDALQKAIDQKEEEYIPLIEKLYIDDVELAKQLEPDPFTVARLKGDDEYEPLLEKRSKLMWVVEPKVEFVD